MNLLGKLIIFAVCLFSLAVSYALFNLSVNFVVKHPL